MIVRASAALREDMLQAPRLIFDQGIIRVFAAPMPDHSWQAAAGLLLGYVTADGNPFIPGLNGLSWISDGNGGFTLYGPRRLRIDRAGIPVWCRLSQESAAGLDDFDDYGARRIDAEIRALGNGLSAVQHAVGVIDLAGDIIFTLPEQVGMQ